MITLKEIAERCDVSVATVSNILNGKSKASAKTAQRVLKVVEETGYKPNYMAQGLRRQRTKTIGLVVDDIAQFTSPPMIESIMDYCEKNGYRVIIRNLRLYNRWAETWHNQEEAYKLIVEPAMHDVLSAQADGVIYIAGHSRILHCFRDDFPVPAVIAYAFSDVPEVPSVVIDDAGSACEVAKCLIENGHKRIGFIGGRADNFHTQQRLLGYQKALFDNGILFDPDLVYYGEWDRQNGYLGAKTLMKKNVSAFFCCADKMAGGVYDYLEEIGKEVAKDISVTGFDDEDMAAYFSPKLTTTKLPLAEVGHKAAELLIQKLENGEEEAFEGKTPMVYKIACSFIQRRSVQKIAEGK